MLRCKAPEILRSETYFAYAATTKDEGKAADERFSTTCKDKTTGKIYILRMEIGNDTLCLLPGGRKWFGPEIDR